MRIWAAIVLVGCMSVLIVAGCGGEKVSGPRELKMGYVMAPVGAAHEAAQKFADLVKEKTNGELTVKLFPSASLGTDRELAEGLTFGSVDIVLSGLASVSSYIPQYEVLEAPFAFRDYDHLRTVLDGEIGAEVDQALADAKGIRILAWWPRGPRYLTTNKEVHTPSDLQGMKLRVPELPTYIEAWRILGANPTPITYSEMFMALKQDVVEGQENPLEVIYSTSLYDVQDYVIETKHLLSTYQLMVGQGLLDSLSEEQRTALTEAAKEAADYEFELMQRKESEYIGLLKEKGMTFVEVDPSLFREPVVEQLPKIFADRWAPGIFERIQAVEP